jgi:cell division protease FtsH
MARAKQILTDHAEGHHQLAQLLIEREVITSEDVARILGPRPWKSRGDQLLEANAALVEAEKTKKRAPRKKKSETTSNDIKQVQTTSNNNEETIA